jgi:transcriptional regulator with XRE-family HTH domain
MLAMNAYEAERAEILKKFGVKLAQLRDPNITQSQGPHTSQETFARQAGLHRNEIGFLERGKREPKLLTLLILADSLEVSVAKLLEDLPVPEERRSKIAGKSTPARRPKKAA